MKRAYSKKTNRHDDKLYENLPNCKTNYFLVKKLYSIFAVIALSIASLYVNSQSFSIQGSKIVAPNGTEFIPVGANVNGFNFQG